MSLSGAVYLHYPKWVLSSIHKHCRCSRSKTAGQALEVGKPMPLIIMTENCTVAVGAGQLSIWHSAAHETGLGQNSERPKVRIGVV